MKYLKGIGVIILLFLLPLGSWYFLQSGLDWRKAKRETLKKKVRFMTAYDFSNADKDKLFELSVRKTNVVKTNGNLTDLDKSLIKQFQNSHTFQFLVISDGVPKPEYLSSKSVQRYFDPENQNAKHDYLQAADYLLVDTLGYIRQYYEGKDKSTLNYLVEDVALILPKVQTRDILMKRQAVNNE